MFRVYLLLGILAAAGAAWGYHQITVSQYKATVAQLEANNRTLKDNQVQLELAASTAEKSLREAEENAAKQSAAIASLTTKNNELQRDKENAMKIFKDHNLTRLARAKPGLIEKRANNKTADVFRMLENDTKELMDADDAPEPTGVPDAEGSGTS